MSSLYNLKKKQKKTGVDVRQLAGALITTAPLSWQPVSERCNVSWRHGGSTDERRFSYPAGTAAQVTTSTGIAGGKDQRCSGGTVVAFVANDSASPGTPTRPTGVYVRVKDGDGTFV